MQVQFSTNLLPCLEQIQSKIQTREQTQEVHIPESMPEPGEIIGAWGQVLIRGKQWRSGSMELSCGVMTWVMYRPEDGGQPQMVEAWIPMSFQWDIPPEDIDGVMQITCRLCNVDARSVSARRLMVRCSVAALGQAMMPREIPIPVPENLPEHICLQTEHYPLDIISEAGEKHFELDEELTLPPTAVEMEKLLRFSLNPELMEETVMAGKVVFRGIAWVHILYCGIDGNLYPFDFQIPFSQYGELEQLYEHDAQAQICLAVTALELEAEPDGRMRLQAGISGQYQISKKEVLCIPLDAYSPAFPVTLQQQKLVLPVLLEQRCQPVTAEHSFDLGVNTVVDVDFSPCLPQIEYSPNMAEAELSGRFRILHCDREGTVQGTAAQWEDHTELPGGEKCHQDGFLLLKGIPQVISGVECKVRSELDLRTQIYTGWELSVLTGLEIDENAVKDPNRPSLILRRAGNESLWEIAKAAGSTVAAIQEANNLQEEPEADRMLLIPIL